MYRKRGERVVCTARACWRNGMHLDRARRGVGNRNASGGLKNGIDA